MTVQAAEAAIAVRCDVPQSLAAQMELANALAASGILPNHLQGKPANVLAIMYAARAMDIPLWTAVTECAVVNGKVAPSANIHRAMVQRAGHRFRVVDSSPTSATVAIIRRDDPDYEHTATFTMAEAAAAKLNGKDVWKSYPAAMLVHRATTLLVRQACADVMSGMSAYTPEELGADFDEDGRVITGEVVREDPRRVLRDRIAHAAATAGLNVADLQAGFTEAYGHGPSEAAVEELAEFLDGITSPASGEHPPVTSPVADTDDGGGTSLSAPTVVHPAQDLADRVLAASKQELARLNVEASTKRLLNEQVVTDDGTILALGALISNRLLTATSSGSAA